jgi:hypothetical protein
MGSILYVKNSSKRKPLGVKAQRAREEHMK